MYKIIIYCVQDRQQMFKWPDHIADLNGTLYFQKVKPTDKGKYTCVATSSQGIINTTIFVDVIGKPYIHLALFHNENK